MKLGLVSVRALAIVGLVALGAPACRGATPTTPGMSARMDRSIRGWYARRWGCDSDALTSTRVGEVPNDTGLAWSIYGYAGCGHSARLFTACEFADQCSEWSESVEARAAHDFDCPVTGLKLRVLEKSTLAVDGCGHKATYISVPGGGWVLNNDGERRTSERRSSVSTD